MRDAADGSTWGELVREREILRERLLRGVLWFLAGVLALTIPLLTVLAKAPTVNRVVYFCALAALLAAAVAPRVRFAIRAATFALALYGVATISMLWGGYTPNAFLAFGLLVVVITLVLGRRAGFVAAGVSALTILAISLLHRTDHVSRFADWANMLDDTRLPVMIRVVAISAMVMATFVVAISYVVARGEDVALGKIRALSALQSEQASRMRVQAELLERESALRKAQELEILGRLAGSMAHDFNNALLVIAMAVDELEQRTDLSVAAQSAVGMIRQAGDQAATATRGLRAFGPQGAGDSHPVDLANVTRRTTDLLKRLLPPSIQIQTELVDGVTIASNDALVQRVVTNLALNARDAMRDGGRLTLRMRRASHDHVRKLGAPVTEPAADNWIVLDVEDTGAGMTPEIMARVFEPFFTTKDAAGTGLGLSSVREMVEAQRGHVVLSSQVGVGTRVSVCWIEVDRALTPMMSAPRAQASGNGITVLVVDDEAVVRDSMVRGLARQGFTMLEAGDGSEGLLVARRHREAINVLCCDCEMPGLHVRHLVEGFRAAHPDGRVLVCSGNAPDNIIPLQLVDGFLPKPFGGEVLGRRILELLSPARQRPQVGLGGSF